MIPWAEETAVPQLFREDEGLDNAAPVLFDGCVNLLPGFSGSSACIMFFSHW